MDNNDFPRGIFETLYRSELDSFWFRGRQRIIEFLVQKYLDRTRTAFLEIGCGTGFVLQGLSKFSHLKLTGSELDPAGLQWAKERLPQVDLIQLDAARMPFKDHFDAIGAFDVIEHIEDDLLILKRCYEALRAGGWLFLTVPQHRCLWSQADDFGRHKRRYSRKELFHKLEQMGFEVRFISSFVFALFPMMYLSRLIKRRQKPAGLLQACELKFPRVFDALGEAVMRIEEKLIFSGLSLPWGGSLAVAARKRLRDAV